MKNDLTQTPKADGRQRQRMDSKPPGSAMTAEGQSRRRFLTQAPKALTGTAIGAAVLGLAPGSVTKSRAVDAPAIPWPYTALDSVLVAERAYSAYALKGCMYGVFEGIIGELRAQIGSPYDTFPFGMMEYGKGGINGVWGTLCGTLNGSAAAINLVSSSPSLVINEVFYWYCQELLPNYRPQNPRYEIAGSISLSPICHASVQRWCEMSGFTPKSAERAERCAWLTAAVAKYTAEKLNEQAAGTFSASHQQSAEAQSCMVCHDAFAPEKVHHGRNMSCTQCHSGIDALHPQKHVQIRWTGAGTLEQANAVTGPWTSVASQSNPQSVPLTNTAKFFRLK